MKRVLIHNAKIVNEGTVKQGSVVLENGTIAEVLTDWKPLSRECDEMIDATGCYLIPGVIDDHVHFRDPGLTHKADAHTESMAAVAGGVTSVMDMPNTVPQTTTLEAWEEKMNMYAEKAVTNYSCYFGATSRNAGLLPQLDRKRVCGIKLFMGASTGNMLVENARDLRETFEKAEILIATHCEDQKIIKQNIEKYKKLYPDGNVPLKHHRDIRSAKACLASSEVAVELARTTGKRLHILHISTARELELFGNGPLEEKLVTAEACIGHLCFSAVDYRKMGAGIKCNPAIKTKSDMEALRKAVNDGRIDVIGTDHAPHLLSEKEGGALKAASGIPIIQFSLYSMLNLVDEGVFTFEKIVEKMCHAPARLYQIDRRGYIREGYHGDVVLIRPDSAMKVTKEGLFSKCGWSPLEGRTFGWKVEKTFVNGRMVYDGKSVDEDARGEELVFTR